MAVKEVSIAAATAVLGYDLFRDEPDIKTSDVFRALQAAALGGSAAALDSKVDLKVGSVVVASIYNARTGMPTNDDLVGIAVMVPPGSPISAIVTDAPATNPLNLRVVVEDLQ